MKYSTGSAFRRALEDKILQLHRDTGVPITRYRKLIAFNRFLARLVTVDPGGWVLKGGYLMELQFKHKARTTKDIDLLFREQRANIHKTLIKASKTDLSDWFNFQVGNSSTIDQNMEKTIHYPVVSLLDSRTFESFHLDVNADDILYREPEMIDAPTYVAFPEFSSFQIPCYSLPQQTAEKFHALTRVYASGEVSRVKDLVDILLIASSTKLGFNDLHKAITLTFKHRKTHDLPEFVPRLSTTYTKSYSRLAAQSKLQQTTLSEANLAFDKFITPVLTGNSFNKWNPRLWKWS
jgi:hypothetical protein